MVYIILLFVLGLVFGSFVSALTYRYPQKISIAKGRSFCPKCKNVIHWYDNIPLLSFIFLKGRCRNCKKSISWRYPLIELTSGLGFVEIYFYTFKGPSLQGLYSIFIFACFLVLFLILLSIFVIDFEHRIIPDDFIFYGIIISLFAFYNSLFSGLAAGFLAAAFLMILHLITKGRGMGLGDVKFAVLGGLIIGIKLLYIWLFLAFLTGGTFGIILILVRRAGLKTKIAFGPFLVIGLLLAFGFGGYVLNAVGY